MNGKKILRDIAIRVTPTFLYPSIWKMLRSPAARFLERHTSLSFFSPRWNTISSGPFSGISIFYDPSANFWGYEANEGIHDKEIFSFMCKQKLKGKVVFDVGAHIGFNALCYAKLVGPKGKVHAFEPNRFNRERMKKNLEHNTGLRDRITVSPIALSNKKGYEDFFFSSEIEDGTSSGSVIASIKSPREKNQYTHEFQFQVDRVRTETLDAYVQKNRIAPDVIKIDVEGAESIVLTGAQETLKKKPLILVELHTIANGHEVTALLARLGYSFEILKIEGDGRTFIAAT